MQSRVRPLASVGARFSSSRTIHCPLRTAVTRGPSLKTRRPDSSDTYDPRYSWRSVCSWLLMRTNSWPVWAARYWTNEVLPDEVGPYEERGRRVEEFGGDITGRKATLIWRILSRQWSGDLMANPF